MYSLAFSIQRSWVFRIQQTCDTFCTDTPHKCKQILSAAAEILGGNREPDKPHHPFGGSFTCGSRDLFLTVDGLIPHLYTPVQSAVVQGLLE
jgi:hypothetical protein